MQRLAGRPFINELQHAGWPVIFIYGALKIARDSVLLPDAKPELLAVTQSLAAGQLMTTAAWRPQDVMLLV